MDTLLQLQFQDFHHYNLHHHRLYHNKKKSLYVFIILTFALWLQLSLNSCVIELMRARRGGSHTLPDQLSSTSGDKTGDRQLVMG